MRSGYWTTWPTWRVAGRAGADHAAQLDRPPEGAYVDFVIEGRGAGHDFHPRPDTLYGATFFVIAPEAPLAADVVTDEHRAEFEDYLEQTKRVSEIERQSTERPKTGVFLGTVNPVNGRRSRCTPPTTCWPSTAPAPSWPCRRTINATWTSPGRTEYPFARWWTPAVRSRDFRDRHARRRDVRQLRRVGRAERQDSRHRKDHRQA